MATNVVDVLIRLRSDVSKFAIGLASIATVKALIANIEEAQAATVQLDAAFRATGQGLGLTRERLDELASSLQETTTISDDLVKQSEAVLLTFNRVRGEAFERTIKAAADLSARFGGDLTSSVKILGKALQDPERGLVQLRRAGVTFTDSQIALVKALVDSGRAAQAQNIILAEVEKRFKGAAEAARNTLGGALEGLKNAFGDLFEGSEKGISGSVRAINDLSKALNDPKIKEGIDNIIAAFAKLIEAAARFAAFIARSFTKLGQASGNLAAKLIGEKDVFTEINELLKQRVELQRLIAQGRNDTFIESTIRGTGSAQAALDEEIKAQGISEKDLKAFFENKLRFVEARIAEARTRFAKKVSEPDPTIAPTEPPKGGTDDAIDQDNLLTEIIITNRKKIIDANEQVFLDFNEETKTAQELEVTRFEETKAKLLELREAGRITAEEFNARLGEAQDKLLPEFDLTAIRSQLKTVETQASETALIVKGAFEQAGASIQSTLSDAIQSGKLSLKSLVDVARKAIADILAAILVSGIKKALASQLSGAGGGAGSGKAGFLKSLAGAFLGAKASGGRENRPFIAGEEGPELVFPGQGSSQVFNKRQLQFAGGRGGNTFAPVTNISIIERDNPERTRQETLQIVALQNARNEERFMQRLARNGVIVR